LTYTHTQKEEKLQLKCKQKTSYTLGWAISSLYVQSGQVISRWLS